MKTLNDISLAIQHGRLQSALEALVKIVQDKLSDQKELRSSIISLLARYNQLQAKRARGLLAASEVQLTENQISFATTEMVEILRIEFNGRESPPAIVQENENHRIRILFFAANPMGDGQINLGREMREIEGSLARAKLSGRFEFIPATATRPKDFLRRILEIKPDFVHFSGHGSRDGVYMLDDEDESILMPAQQLSDVFKLFREVVGCVLLNACYSEHQAGKVRDFIPNVIGTTRKIGDDAAIEFATLFYSAIGEGNDIPFAYEFARLGLDLNEMEGDIFSIG